MAVAVAFDSDHLTALTDEAPSTTSINVTAPAATEVGDFVAIMRHHSAGFISTLGDGDPPINIGSYGLIGNNTNSCIQFVTRRAASDLNWSWSVNGGTSRAWACLRFTGVDESEPLRDYAANFGGSTTGDVLGFASSATITGLDCAVDGCMAVVLIQTEGATVSTSSTGWDVHLLCGPGAGSLNRRLYCAFKTFPAAGSSSESVTLSLSANTRFAGRAFVLNPRRAPVPNLVPIERIAVCGDSITAGPHVGVSRRWVDKVLGTCPGTTTDGNTAWFNGWFNGTEIRAWCFAQSGANALEFVANYDVSSSKSDGGAVTPDVLVLNFGANDELDGRTPAQFSADLVALADGAGGELPKCPFVLVVGQWAWSGYGGGGQPSGSVDHAEFLAAAADAVEQILELDHVQRALIVTCAADPVNGGGTNSAVCESPFAHDHIHPNELGQREVWAPMIRFGLQQLLALSPTTVHSMAASVSTATAIGATLRKRSRVARGVSATTTVSATPQMRYRMATSVSASATITALLTDAALIHGVGATIAASATATATATVRRQVAASVGAVAALQAVLGRRQGMAAFIFTETTTAATADRRIRMAAAVSTSTAVEASLRKVFLLSASIETTAQVDGTVRVRRQLLASVDTDTTVRVAVVGADMLEPVIGNVRKVYLTTYVKKRNRMDRLELSSITEEFIDVQFVSKNNVVSYPVEMALSAVGEEPGTWVAAEWVTDESDKRGTKWFNTARCLAGGAGLNIDTPGEYQLWIRVSGPNDTPTKKAGTVAVS